MSRLLVLSLWQPWAMLFCTPDPGVSPPRACKESESRHFIPRVQPPFDVAVHATKAWRPEARAVVGEWPFADCLRRVGYYPGDPRPFAKREDATPGGLKLLPLGAIVGVVTIDRVLTAEAWLAQGSQFEDGAAEHYAEDRQLGWYAPGRFAWHGTNPRPLPEPIPFSGRQDVLYPLADDVAARVWAQLEHAPNPAGSRA